jgi:hypothetical protein
VKHYDDLSNCPNGSEGLVVSGPQDLWTIRAGGGLYAGPSGPHGLVGTGPYPLVRPSDIRRLGPKSDNTERKRISPKEKKWADRSASTLSVCL